jgi:hypothetical protein
MNKFKIKDRLAKLLAGENIVVEHRNVSTASFEVEQRILILPMWALESNAAYDTLIGHEVGHALYTPLGELEEFMTNRNTYMDGKYKEVPFSYMNIVEDIRIEKMLQKKFPGFRKIFKKGYKDLNDLNFFGIKDTDVDEMSFADRLNLHFKLGSECVIRFSEKEYDVIENINNGLNTFEDVLDSAFEMQELKMKESKSESDLSVTDLQRSTGFKYTSQDKVPERDSDNDQMPEGQFKGDDPKFGPTPDFVENSNTDIPNQLDDEDVTTTKAFERMLNRHIVEDVKEIEYANIPDVNIDNIVVPISTIAEYINTKCRTQWCSPFTDGDVSKQYSEFKKQSQSSVNFMIKEFQSKKTAAEYSRSYSTSSGVLDPKKLHTYKFNENLFKQIRVVYEGQNHGMIFLIDWSGSMSDSIVETTKQLLQLVWFCYKQNIPFDVYAFTNQWYKYSGSVNWNYDENPNQTIKSGDLYVDRWFNLLNVISSRRTAKEFESDCKNFYTLAHGCKHSNLPASLSLGSTPLNAAIIALRTIIPKFYEKTKVDKLSTIILTDGESDSLGWYRPGNSHSKVYDLKDHLNRDCVLTSMNEVVIQDRKLGISYPRIKNASTWYYNPFDTTTNILLENLKDNFPDMNLVGIRLVEPAQTSSFLMNYDTNQNQRSDWARDRSCAIHSTAYDILYGMSVKILSKDSTLEVPKDASLTKINNAIKKSLKAKNANRKILHSFIQLIA